jgi:hypothetical protein
MRTKFDIKNQNKLNRKGWNWKTKIAIKKIKIKYDIKIKSNLISRGFFTISQYFYTNTSIKPINFKIIITNKII